MLRTRVKCRVCRRVVILHYSHCENAVCIWPLASCLKMYPRHLCPTCESWMPAASGFGSSPCLLDWCCTSCNAFWHQRTTYSPSRLHTTQWARPLGLCKSELWKDITAVEGWTSVYSVAPTVSLYFARCTPLRFAHGDISAAVPNSAWHCTRSGCPRWVPLQSATARTDQVPSEILSQYVRQKQRHVANSTLFW